MCTGGGGVAAVTNMKLRYATAPGPLFSPQSAPVLHYCVHSLSQPVLYVIECVKKNLVIIKMFRF